MFTRLSLTNFKSFASARLDLAPFTVLVGTNASGKSNVRDALRVLHAVGRGYTLPEVFGERWSEAGTREWSGIRGGPGEVIRRGAESFTIEAECDDPETGGPYVLGARVDRVSLEPMITEESFSTIFDYGNGVIRFPEAPEYFVPIDTLPSGDVEIHEERAIERYDPIRPLLPRLDAEHAGTIGMRVRIATFCARLRGIRFIDPTPSAMRAPSPPGVRRLGDHGENLASVLEGICEDASRKSALVEWLRQLTPVDVRDIGFERVYEGRVALYLVEQDGAKTSAASASDGTLRFLSLLAALFTENERLCLVIEELDTGIHPTRLRLLIELIESRCEAGGTQVIATTHSPVLLTMLSARTREAAALVFRRPDGASDIKRVVDLPAARAVLAKQDLARLHTTGWLENVASFDAANDDAKESSR